MADDERSDKRQAPRQEEPKPSGIHNEVRPFTWADPGTWSASLKFLPAYVLLVAIFIALYYNHFADSSLDLTTYESCAASFDYGFRVNAALSQAHEHSKRSWEIGYAYEGTQQIYNPDRSVFGRDPFPGGKLPKLALKMDEASLYIEKKINRTEKTLFGEENGAISDPAALGVAALQFAQKKFTKGYVEAATRQKDFLLNEAPRHSNGAISHRSERVELWSDAIAMVPPFLAYYGVATNDLEMIQQAVLQIEHYRDLLLIRDGPKSGLWKHIVSNDGDVDAEAWSTGNAWAAYGMARVRATIAAWPVSNAALSKEIQALDSSIEQILDAAIKTDDDKPGLLKNYLGDKSSQGESSGTSLLAATAYRMAILVPDRFGKEKYISWANNKRKAVFERVDGDGIAKPAVNPYEPRSEQPIDLSPEGQSFLLLLGSAWRDCVCGGPPLCRESYIQEHPTEPTREYTFEALIGYPIESAIQMIKEPVDDFLNHLKGLGA
ncbi:ankyrin repeat [Lecanosticta acicola]|uniref:Ankyrin repeat n=1 Tax=Lecanosticta acicola TaxID=111012 RepID=A0AAI9E7G9_9PEZI|nr:ankyrin repeat [Lecanosticta acicola]